MPGRDRLFQLRPLYHGIDVLDEVSQRMSEGRHELRALSLWYSRAYLDHDMGRLVLDDTIARVAHAAYIPMRHRSMAKRRHIHNMDRTGAVLGAAVAR